MRGTLDGGSPIWLIAGIIPAHAGNTNVFWSMTRTTRDHPRACGEHLMRVSIRSSDPGSSPRMRGTLTVGHATGSQHGIIPAHAGNTRGARRRPTNHQDHPRACGEHPTATGVFLIPPGSSPRMRGTHPMRQSARWYCGIIPAHAGNTCVGSC